MVETRRLAAIMFADMAGFTAATHNDEAGTLHLVQEQEELVGPLLAAHKGRMVKSTGDGFLAEFESALRAIQCAIDIQQHLHERNARPGLRPIPLRIGVHLGDVEQRGTDIFGDAVNIAARVEPLADPGGVCLSEPVFVQVRNKIPYRLDSLGPKSLKGVPEAIGIYRVLLPWDRTDTPPRRLAEDISHRIAVLPFKNISPNAEDEFFADGLTEEITAELAQLPGLLVIARTSVERYKAASEPIEEIGKVLRVGAVLEGSVRKAGSKIRVTAQLIDAESEAHVWSASFDRDFNDIFAIQSDIARGVAEALKIRLLSSETKGPEQPLGSNTEVFSLYLKGRVEWARARTEEELNRALGYFNDALAKDPGYAAAYVGVANCYHELEHVGRGSVSDALQKSKDAAEMAIRLDPRSAEAHEATCPWFQHTADWESAEREHRRALELNPNLVEARLSFSPILRVTGRPKEALEQARRALECDPLSYGANLEVGREYRHEGRYDEAIFHIKNAIDLGSEWSAGHRELGLAYVKKGLVDEGLEELQQARSLGTGRQSEILADLAWANSKAAKTQELDKILAELLSHAGQNADFDLAIAAGYAISGDVEKSLGWIDRALRDPQRFFPGYLLEAWFENLRGEPRFLEILRSQGLNASGLPV